MRCRPWSGLTVRGADLVLAVSSDLAANARRPARPTCGSPRRCAPPLPPARRGRARSAPSWASPTGRPLVVAVGPAAPAEGLRRPPRRRRRGGPAATTPPLLAIAGDGPLHDELAARIAAERLPVVLLGPARRRRRPARRGRRRACCPRAGRAAPSPPRRRCAPAPRWSPPAPAASPSWWGRRPTWCPVGDAAGAGRRAGAGAHRPRARRRRWPRRAAGRRRSGRTRRAPGRRVVAVYRELLGPPEAGSPVTGARRWVLPLVPAARGPARLGATGLGRGGGRRTTPRGPRAGRRRPRAGLERRRPHDDPARSGRWPSRASIGALSVRAARGTTCLLDGWATLGAGNRARFPGPDDGLPPVPLPTVPLPEDGPGAPVPGSAPDRPGRRRGRGRAAGGHLAVLLRAAGADRRRGAGRPGGHRAAHRRRRGHGPVRRRARRAGRGRRLRRRVGPGGRAGGGRTRRAPWTAGSRCRASPADLTAFLDGLRAERWCRWTSSPSPAPPATTGPTTAPTRCPRATRPGPRSTSRSAGCRTPSPQLPGETLVLLAGISEVNDGRPQLHVGIASGPGFDTGGWLDSASTGRAPYVQLIDLAPTALRRPGAGRAGVDERPAAARRRRPAGARRGGHRPRAR